MKKSLLTTILCLGMGLNAMAQSTLTVNVSNEKLQKITGFGAAALENLMRPTQDVDIIRKAYEPESPIGLNILRMELSPNEKGDINASDIGWDTPYDWHGQLGAVKEAKRHGAIVFATPWSPAPYLKSNDSAAGGESEEQGKVRATLKEGMGKQLFIWFNKFLNYMSSNGAPVDAVSFQNEPDWWVSYSGCLYSPEQMYNVIKENSQWFNKSYFKARFIAGEPLGFNPDYFHRLLNDPVTNQFCDILAGHVYGNYDCKKNIATIRSWAPDKEIWMTEHSVNAPSRSLPTWQEQLDFCEDVNECLINGCTAYIYWYLCKDFGFIYDGNKYDQNPCKGHTTEERGDILPRGYLMGQFARQLKGATMLKNTRSIKDIASTPGVNQRFEISTFQLGDSIIVNAIDTMSSDFNLKITLPFVADAAKAIRSTQNGLCVEEDITVTTPSKEITVFVPRRSFSTFIFHTPDPTATRGIEIDEVEENVDATLFTADGIRSNGKRSGLYIKRGRTFMHNAH